MLNNRRRVLSLLAVVATTAVLWFLSQTNQPLSTAPTQATAPQLKVKFLDVGQGDAILIQAPGGQKALIDGGESSQVLLNVLGEQLGWFDHNLDLVILTHPHSDHLGGLNGLFGRFKIGQVVATLVNANSSIYEFWLEHLKSANITIKSASWPDEFSLGPDVKLQILNPANSLAGQDVSNLNNSSLVILLTYRQSKFLLMGDSEVEVEKDLLNRGLDLQAQVLKVAHHGSSTATSQEFLEAVGPELAVISVGRNNDFGHPHQRVLNRLERADIKILRTDQLGTITLVSDSQTIDWIN